MNMKMCLLLGFMFLLGCSHKASVSKFACITAFGIAQFSSDDPGVSITNSGITLHQESSSISFSHSMCVEVKDK